MAQMTNNMTMGSHQMASTPFTSAGQLSEDMVKQHLSQLMKKQGKRSAEFLSDPDSSDIDKNMIYE